MSFEYWLAFAVASAVVLVIPGPTILTVIAYSLANGRRARLPLVAAVALGDCTSLALSLLGLGALLAASSAWFGVIKLAGGLYLIWLGIGMLRAGAGAAAVAPPPPAAPWRLFLNTYWVTALNPKGIVFFAAFLPQFVDPAAETGRQLWILACTFVVMAVINASAYALFASSAQHVLTSAGARRRFDLAGGGLLTAAGVWTLWARRAA